ncbi:MAG: ABC transporter permease subunit [Planctomycetota bacterium]|nr:ABC transporter permease subunit [Planctomycetota bacterium]
MFQQLLAITRNTFFESIRQPIMLVVVISASILIVLSNPLSAFTMDENQRMLVDIGLATVFLAGAVLAAFIATNVLGREIENKTALTVISKPVTRPVFMIGKYLGVAGAMMVASLCMTLVFMLVELHTVIETVKDPVHVPVVIFGLGGALLGLLAATWCNYFYGMVFSSSVIAITTPILFLAYLLALNFGPDFSSQSMWLAFESQIWLAVVSIMMAILVLCAIAVAVSTRFGQLVTLVCTVGLFLLGLLSDWIFGRGIERLEAGWLDTARLKGLVTQEEVIRRIEWTTGEVEESMTIIDVATVPLSDMATTGEYVTWIFYWIGYSVLPNFQILWLSDALTQDTVIPYSYLLSTLLYGGFYSIGVLGLGIILFQRREVG